MNEIFKREKSLGKQVRWVGAKLFVRDHDGNDFREVKA